MKKFEKLRRRLGTAVVGALLMVSGIWFHEFTYGFVFMVIMLATMVEFYGMTRDHNWSPLYVYGLCSGSALFILTFMVESGRVDPTFYYLIFPLYAIAFIFMLYRKKEENPFINIGLTFLGILYISVPFSCLNFLSFHFGDYLFQIPIGIMVLLWAHDIGAYFFGIAFGKHKLFERVSPKKSWEGSLGGTALALVVAWGLAQFFPQLTLWQWMLAALIAIVAGTYGDLVESMLKRSYQMKDSGKLLPGHGGFLDRFDGLLLALPFMVFLFKMVVK